MMNEVLFAERIAKLRAAKGVSARDMSLSIKQEADYMDKIESCEINPSMNEFMCICKYLGISPKNFFNYKQEENSLIDKILSEIHRFDQSETVYILQLAKKINKRKK